MYIKSGILTIFRTFFPKKILNIKLFSTKMRVQTLCIFREIAQNWLGGYKIGSQVRINDTLCLWNFAFFIVSDRCLIRFHAL